MLKNKVCVVLVLFFVYLFSFSAFAFTSVSEFNLINFENGPWTMIRAGINRYGSSGVSSVQSLPTWREDMNWYQYSFFPNSSFDYYVFTYFSTPGFNNNIVIRAESRLDELCILSDDGNVIADVRDLSFLGNYGNDFIYCISCVNGTGFQFKSNNFVYISEMNPNLGTGDLYEFIVDNMPVMGGIYDNNGIAIRFPGLIWDSDVKSRAVPSGFGFDYIYFPTYANDTWDYDVTSYYRLFNNDGVINSGSDYRFVFDVFNSSMGSAYFDASSPVEASFVGNVATFILNGIDCNASSFTFGFKLDNPNNLGAYCFHLSSVTSDDIGILPPDDSGSGDGSGTPDYSSALSAIGSSLKDLKSGLTQGTTTIVNNITNQTTQITNTITNTVTNMTQQITQGLQSVQQGITDKLGVVQDGITNKLQNVQDGINNKLESVQEEIVNGYDNSAMESEKSELSGSVEELEQAEKEVMDNVTGYLEDFEYPTFDSISGGVLASIAFIGTFLQSLFLAIGDFGLIITFSLTMIFVLIIVGYHRIRT